MVTNQIADGVAIAWETLLSQSLIADGARIVSRMPEISVICSDLEKNQLCVAAGPSGSGKSGIAKTIGLSHYSKRIAIPAEMKELFSEPSQSLRHSLTEILRCCTDQCLVFFDSVERCSDESLRTIGRQIASLRANPLSQHIHFLLTSKEDEVSRVIDQLASAGVDPHVLEPRLIEYPPEEKIGKTLLNASGIAWATLHQDLRPVLRNLKVLDWVYRASKLSNVLTGTDVTGLPALIDFLWIRWIQSGESGLARGGLLKQLAIREADTFASSVPLTHFGPTDQDTLGDLAKDDIVRIRHERVQFSHDLLGDWARLRVLIGEDAIDAALSADAMEFKVPTDQSDDEASVEDRCTCPSCGGEMILQAVSDKPSWSEVMSSSARPPWYECE